MKKVVGYRVRWQSPDGTLSPYTRDVMNRPSREIITTFHKYADAVRVVQASGKQFGKAFPDMGLVIVRVVVSA